MLGRDDVTVCLLLFTMAVQVLLLPPSGQMLTPRFLYVQYLFIHVLDFWYFLFRMCDLRPVLNCRSCYKKTHTFIPMRL